MPPFAELHLPQPCYTEGDNDTLLRLYQRVEDADDAAARGLLLGEPATGPCWD